MERGPKPPNNCRIKPNLNTVVICHKMAVTYLELHHQDMDDVLDAYLDKSPKHMMEISANILNQMERVRFLLED